MRFLSTPVRVQGTCENCHKPVDLECEGFAGPAGYATYNEFTCPHCGKITRARTPGAIIAAHRTDAGSPASSPQLSHA